MLLCSQRGVQHTLRAKILSCQCPRDIQFCGMWKIVPRRVSCTSAPSWSMIKDSPVTHLYSKAATSQDTKGLKTASHWNKSLLQVPFQSSHKAKARFLKGTNRLQRTPLENRSTLRQPSISLLYQPSHYYHFNHLAHQEWAFPCNHCCCV